MTDPDAIDRTNAAVVRALDRIEHTLTDMIIHLLTCRPVEDRPAQSREQNRNRG